MGEAATDRVEQQVRQAFPEGVITRVRVLRYGDGPKAARPALRPFTGS